MSDDVTSWLEEHGLGKYAEAFVENDATASELPLLTEDDLREIGLPVGARRRFLAAVSEARKHEDVPSTTFQSEQTSATGEAERRQLTVMFCDLVGSTEMSQQLDPEDLREVNRAYQDACKTAIEHYDGYVARYMGDGVLAYFGYPQAHEDDAERAVRAGFAVIDGTVSLNDRPAKHGEQLAVRVGIATGPVVVGDVIGQGASQESTAIGETPNLAARLQAMAEPNSVFISPGTRRLLGRLFEYVDLGPRQLKGFKEEIALSRVERQGFSDTRFEARDVSHAKFVGRVHEAGLLLERWSMARSGEGQVVLISGEPGIGKSRLVEVLRERVMDDPNVLLRYQCSPYHANSAFYPVIAHLQHAARFAAADTVDERLAKLEALLGQPDDGVPSTVSLMASLLSLSGEPRYGPVELTPQQQKEQTLNALIAQLVALAQQLPVLFIFEDAHWIDPTTRDLLERTIARIEDVPVLMVITHRPGTLPNWADSYGHATALTLSRLGRRKVRELARAVAGNSLAEAIIERIADRSDGIPLFVEELTKSVMEAGVEAESEIPESLQASLLARFDRLGDVKELAQIGATIGREFSHRLVAKIANRSKSSLAEGLARLVGSELIFQRGEGPNAIYIFKHALIQDTAYSTLLESKRRELHLATAIAIEAVTSDTLESAPEVLAHHYARGGEPERAADFWIEAGRGSTERSAYSEADAQLNSAIAALKSLPPTEGRLRRELSVWVALGPVYMATKGPSSNDVEATYKKAAELSEQLGDREQQFRSLFGQWHMNNGRGRCSRAKEIALELLDQCVNNEVSEHDLHAHHAYWSTAFVRGDFAGCREHTAIGLELYEPDVYAEHKSIYAGHDAGVCCHLFCAWIGVVTGNTQSALNSVKHGLNLSERLEHPYSSMTALLGASKTFHILQQAKQTIDLARKGLEFAESFGVRGYVPVLQMLEWSARAVQLPVEELTPCIAGVNGAFDRWKETGAGMYTPWFHYELAKLYVRTRDFDRALDHLTGSLQACETNDERWLESEIHRLLAHAEEAQGTPHDSTRVNLEKALTIAEVQGANLFRLRAANDLALSWLEVGEKKLASQILIPAYASVTEGPYNPDLNEAKALLDRLS